MKLVLKAFVRPHVRTQNGKKIHVNGYQNSKPQAAPHQDPDDKDQREWIGVDLDKTLAFHEPGTGASAIGHPVPSMIRRVRDWLKAGKRVKIFTARAHDPKQIPVVQDWLVKHGLPKLEVTNIKDPLMSAIYDDKAVGIHPNTGRRKDRASATGRARTKIPPTRIVSIDKLHSRSHQDIAEHLQSVVPALKEMSPQDVKDQILDLVQSPTVVMGHADPAMLKKQFVNRGTSDVAVKRFREMLRQGVEFDPVLLNNGKFEDGGHRVEAYLQEGRKSIPTVDIGALINMDWGRWLSGDMSYYPFPKALAKSLVLKANIKTYTKKDGTVVQAHTDKRSAKQERMAPVKNAVHHAPDAFHAWFGDSKVVGKDGKPLTVYHGTTKEFTQFKAGKRGAIYFHFDPALAGQYARGGHFVGDKDSHKRGGRLIPVHLKAEKTWDYQNNEHIGLAMAAMKNSPGYEDWMQKELHDGDWEMIERKEVLAAIKQAGFDSIFVNDHPGKAIGVFSPNQIKSALGNQGTFDPKNKNITKSAHMSLLLKTHIRTYTKKDGTVVAAHQDKRPSAKKKGPKPKAPWEHTQAEFLAYHRTGFIPSSAYTKYETSEGLDFIHDADYPHKIVTMKVGDVSVDIRESRRPLQYVKYGHDGEIVRDASGLATYLTTQEMEEKGLPLFDTNLAAFVPLAPGTPRPNPVTSLPARYAVARDPHRPDSRQYFVVDTQSVSARPLGWYYETKEEAIKEGIKTLGLNPHIGDRPIGFASNEFGTAGVWVVREFQGKGLGTYLLKEFMKRSPNIGKIGQMTDAGENLTRAYHKDLVLEAMKQGEPVPAPVLKDYPDLTRKRHATETEAFKKWFGNSKVVDEKGKPLVVYHGTADVFSEFTFDHPNRKDDGWLGRGFYFTSDPVIAGSYTSLKPGESPNVLPVFLALKNPYMATVEEKRDLQFKSIKNDARAIHEWTSRLEAEGHDGVMLRYQHTENGKNPIEYMVFSPTQIKSAIGNQGTFDPSNPDIAKCLPMRDARVQEGAPMFKSAQGSKSPWPAGLLRLKRGGKGGGFKIDYKTTFQGLPITIENRKGSIRHWENPDDGTSGETKFEYPYGYIRNTEGTDGDHVDCFLGPNPEATHAYIVHQTKAPDFIAHDEDKCMLGWDSAEEAAAAYLRHYNNPRFFGSLTAMPMPEFIQKVRWTKEKPGIIKSTVQKLSILLKAQGERWITVHPHGPGTEGQPVKIRESQGSPGTWHVVGGAGGKLNYLRLTGVKSHEEYKAQAKDRAKDKRAKAKEQVSRDKELGLVESKKQIMGALRSDKEKHERRLVEQVAAAKGWTDYDLKPEHVEGLSDRAKSAAILKHHRQLHRDATAVIRATRETLLLDAEARAEAQLGELSIHRDEPNVIGLTDLSPDPVDRGLGYQPSYGPKDDSIDDEVQEFKDKKKAERDPKEQAKTERMQESAQAVRDEVNQAQESGTLSFGMRDTSAVSPEQALKVLAAEKQTKATLKQIQARKKEVQGSTTEVQGKSYVIQTEPVSSEDVLKDLINDAAERTRQDRATSFLSMVEHDPFEEQPEDHQEALTQHIQSGSAAMLSRISQQLTGVDILPREVVDVLGTAGAAQALAIAFHQNFPEEQIAKWADQLSQYHADNQGTVTEEAIGRAREAYDQAKEMVAESVESPSELAVANELNEKRITLLRSARETLGTTLGELEAMAALHYALQAKPAEETMVSMGGVSTETAIRQLKAIGLGKDDYDVDSDGTNHFALISGAGLGKVVRPIDPEDVAHVQGVNDILDGRNDEDGWLPAGMARRLENDFVDPERQAVAYAEPYHYSTAGAHDDDLKAYIGKRMADGHAVQDVYRDLFGASVLGHIPEGEHEAYFQALERVAPLYDEHNKPRPAESHQEAWEKFSEETLRGHYGESAVPIHQQRVLMDHPKTFEAIHRVIADDPTRGVAFVPTAELKPQEQATLRHVFESRFAAKESDAAMKEAMAEIGEEPEKETEGLFGVQENPEWHQYQARKQQIMADVKSRGLTWDKYLAMHGSRERAYQALQDVLKGESVQAFAKEYGRINKEPLKLGRTVLTNNLSHLDAVNPAARESRLAEQREMTDRLRNRTQGKYASGGVKDKLDQARELSAITDQNQRTMFAVEPEDTERNLPLKEDERHTLGRTAEGQLSAMWGKVSRNFDPQRPVKLMRSKKMDGKFVNQQRAVKLIAHNKRMALALGTGSGKTAIGLGAFTHLHEQGKVKRGFYVVPSIVQAQFGSEAAAVLEPGKYSWWGKPDSPREERIAAYKDPKHHMVIATHQALRDDLVHLMANRAGVTEAEMAEQFKALPEDKQASTMKETMEAEGINPDFFFWDEGHGGLNRAGKEDSLLANTIDAFHRHVPYYVSSSADPIKNDLSELYSQLHKIAPDRFNNQQAFMAKYGLGTNASQDVLRRELRRYLLPGKVDPGIVATHHDEAVGLAEGQKASYDQVMEDYRTARKARQSGAVDLAAMKRLSPSSFDKQDPSTHEELAKRLQENLGIIRDGALDRVLNDTDPAQNAKSHKVLELANKYKAEGKPGVIFARSRKAIDHLHKMLTQEGHRVITLTGSDSAKEKGRKIAKFRPPTGKEPEADIMLASDAGATGANLQRGRYLIHYDMPHTAMTWWQRTGRINRLGQKHDVDIHTLATDTIHDAKKRKRLDRKSGLRESLTAPYESLSDDHDLFTLLRTNEPATTDHEAARQK